MAGVSIYTDQQDEAINRLRFEGYGWDRIAKSIGRNDGGSVRRHAMHARLPCCTHDISRPQPEAKRKTEREAAGHDPLPAMHAISWGCIHPPCAQLGDDGFTEQPED
jgi:hypothetical protein